MAALLVIARRRFSWLRAGVCFSRLGARHGPDGRDVADSRGGCRWNNEGEEGAAGSLSFVFRGSSPYAARYVRANGDPARHHASAVIVVHGGGALSRLVVRRGQRRVVYGCYVADGGCALWEMA
ncbi:hypothetical protein GALMADRAFT_253729 [Galerina marginata CBS 339.88]|uniref:Uncharacterized protein n=1 Tax=Galerina marginata (strain CBS 339.88) TaxID=685588 RepID=A0A067SUP3_GALM3|nr:hypothetical protein GALMADRAFT_253729 [Galerina marginata CBS 339.88]